MDRARFTRKGRQEIRSAAELLAPEPIVAVYSSDLLRSRRTAMAIARQAQCDLRLDRRLRERSFGIAEGVRWVDVPAAASGIACGYVADEMAAPPGGESLHDVYKRCLHFLLDLSVEKLSGDVVIVAHDGSLRMLRAIVVDANPTGSPWDSSASPGVERMVFSTPISTKDPPPLEHAESRGLGSSRCESICLASEVEILHSG